MPTSDFTQIPDIIRVIIQTQAESVLEVGIGLGKWGALCREYIEISRGRMPDEWKSRIEGIEIFERYRNPLWSAYDAVHIGNALELLDEAGTFDIVMCCDVIEHFEKAEGRALLEKMLDHGKIVIITSPRGDSPQEPVYGNAHEEHKSVWSSEDFKPYAYRYADLGETFIAVVARQAASLARVDVRPLREWIGTKGAIRMLARLLRDRLLRRGRA